MRPNQRDICLVPIPFSDLRAAKRRPVLIISNTAYHDSQEDCLVMAITSRIDPQHPYGVFFTTDDVIEGLLPKPSQIRADKIYSVHQKILIRRFGSLSDAKYRSAVTLLLQLVG
ncbi:MAG: type II toxin-antitoxin system PemK/MazF family toxin [Deltaproteobacteria bacterium]|nr:type II toxin-antitoxin system PemK/MazF family toxin [Deltaproteobacteria bacterium]